MRTGACARDAHRAQAELYVLYDVCMIPSKPVVAHELEHGALREHHPESHPSSKWRSSPAHAQRIRTAEAWNTGVGCGRCTIGLYNTLQSPPVEGLSNPVVACRPEHRCEEN
jgi:hypothetical protein